MSVHFLVPCSATSFLRASSSALDQCTGRPPPTDALFLLGSFITILQVQDRVGLAH